MTGSDAAGLYLHVPFCSQVCPYCDFAVRTGDAARKRRYVDHLLTEIELYVDDPWCFDTIYFGGGTPSSLAPEELGRIVDAIRVHLRVRPQSAIFLEANPEDVSVEKLRSWRQLGVEFLSLGIQALDDVSLGFLGRRHDAQRARRSIELAREVDFPTLSIDLIYGLPDDTASRWHAELERAIGLGVDHLSCYQLTIHERTRFGLLAKRGKLVPLANDGQAELFRLTHRYLNDAGMSGYEVSQFAGSVEHRSRHNQKYWDHTPYLGLGPSAHSFRDDRRWWNVRRTDAYQERLHDGLRPVEEAETLDAAAFALEALMTGLRTYAGVDLETIRTCCGVDLAAANGPLVERLAAGGYVTVDGTRIVPTLDGLAVADALARQFEIR